MFDDNNHLLSNRYRIIRLLGIGATGKVYLAEDTTTEIGNNLCAVKELDPRTIDPDKRKIICERFGDEATYLRALNGFNGQIPKFYDYFSLTDGNGEEKHYIVQEYIEGKTLRKTIEDGRVLSEARVKELLLSLLPVLAHIHSKDFIHRDVNPSNIILRDGDETPVLIDFGAVKEVLTTIVASSNDAASLTLIIGKEGYMAPEHLGGRPVFTSDLYSLGVTAIELLSGLKPQEIDRILITNVSLWSHSFPSISRDFAVAIDKAVKRSADQRYSDAQAMLKALESVALPESDETFRLRLGDSLSSLLERRPNTPAESYKKCYDDACDFYVTLQDEYCLNCGAYNVDLFSEDELHLMRHDAEEHLKRIDPELSDSTIIGLGLQIETNIDEIFMVLCSCTSLAGAFIGWNVGEGFFGTIGSVIGGVMFGFLSGALLATITWLLGKAVLIKYKQRLNDLEQEKKYLQHKLKSTTEKHRRVDFHLKSIDKETRSVIKDISSLEEKYKERLLSTRSALKKHSGASELQKEEEKFERALEESQLEHKKYQVKLLEIKLLRLHNKLQAKTDRKTISEETYSKIEEELDALNDLINQIYGDLKGSSIIKSEKGKGWVARILLARDILERALILLIKQRNDLIWMKRKEVTIEPSEEFVINLNLLNTYITCEDFYREYRALKSEEL